MEWASSLSGIVLSFSSCGIFHLTLVGQPPVENEIPFGAFPNFHDIRDFLSALVALLNLTVLHYLTFQETLFHPHIT